MIFEKIRERLQKSKEDFYHNNHRNYYAYNQGLKTAINIVNQVEAEYNNGWISVDDRLPKEKGDYLVTCNDGKIRVWWFVVGHDFKAWLQGVNNLEPIAWQPLPEPYIPKKPTEPEWKSQVMNHFTKGE